MLDLAGNSRNACNIKWDVYPGVDGNLGLDGLDIESGECGRNVVSVGKVKAGNWQQQSSERVR